jgi:hypothetical protein
MDIQSQMLYLLTSHWSELITWPLPLVKESRKGKEREAWRQGVNTPEPVHQGLVHA